MSSNNPLLMLGCNLSRKYFVIADLLAPLASLVVRIWIGMVFFKSGWVKLNQDWETVVMLFTYEHPVPFLPPQFAALSGTFFELVCPVLLFIGLGTRFAVIPLLLMTAVIQFTYLDHKDHLIWALVLFTLMTQGAGKLSVDHWIKIRMRHCKTS